MNLRYLLAVSLTLLACCGAEPVSDPASGPDFLSVASALSEGEADGYARVLGPRELNFPTDHGAHPDHQLEWWYWTGHLEDEEGRPYGFQLTFFRSALAPTAPESESTWATNQSYMAHLSLSDPSRGRFESRERLARGGAGLAGVTAEPFRVWLDDWSATGVEGSIDRVRLFAEAEGLALDIELEPRKPLVLQGEGGFSPKGDELGNASMYVSFTRLAARGSIQIGGRRLAVTGQAWMDHEWSTSVLGEGIAGWDWFSLQLDDGRELMLFELRNKEGGAAAFGDGSLIAADGTTQRLGPEDFSVEVTRRWRSPETGADYPAGWIIRLPEMGLELELEPLMADQELRVSVAYWEGAVRCRGRSPEGEVSGRGFVELVGYSDAVEPADRKR